MLNEYSVWDIDVLVGAYVSAPDRQQNIKIATENLFCFGFAGVRG